MGAVEGSGGRGEASTPFHCPDAVFLSSSFSTSGSDYTGTMVCVCVCVIVYVSLYAWGCVLVVGQLIEVAIFFRCPSFDNMSGTSGEELLTFFLICSLGVFFISAIFPALYEE